MFDDSDENVKSSSAMPTAVVDIGDTSVCFELSHNCVLSTKENLFSCFLSAILFLDRIFDINDILIIFSNCCSQAIVIMMPQCWQIYSDSYNIILFCTCMCYIIRSTCDGNDINC